MPPSTVCAIPSFAALLRTDTTRREARLPNPGDLPDDIAWIQDERFGRVPAVVVLSGVLTAIGEDGTGDNVVRTAQWAICHGPDNEHTRERMSRRDIVDAVQMVIEFLSRLDPMLPRGTSFRVSFAVPKAVGGIAGENYFDVVFDAENPFRRVNRLRPHAYCPWSDPKRVSTIETKIAGLLRLPAMGIWKSWTSDAAIRMLLQHVPMDDHRTEFRPGDVQRVIRSRLPPEMQRTMFVGFVPKEMLGDDPSPNVPEDNPDGERLTVVPIVVFAGFVIAALLYFVLT